MRTLLLFLSFLHGAPKQMILVVSIFCVPDPRNPSTLNESKVKTSYLSGSSLFILNETDVGRKFLGSESPFFADDFILRLIRNLQLLNNLSFVEMEKKQKKKAKVEEDEEME